MATRYPTVDGTPVGDRDSVSCDACNRTIARRPHTLRERDEDLTRGEVLLFLTRAGGSWSLRFVSCPDCGPCGDPDVMAADEATAVAVVDYTPRSGRFVVEQAEQHPALPHPGDRPRLRGET